MKKTENKKTQDLEDRLKRALADYQNLQKRHSQQQADLVVFANQALLDKLLPLLDDLERAQNHLQDSGLQLILDQFRQILTSEAVEEIKVAGQTFDPHLMDCTEVVPGPKDQIISVLTKGYLYHDRVLRPARVTVGSGNLETNN